MIGCATCGARPIGSFNDGSPRFPATCDHPPITGVPAWNDDKIVIELDAFEMVEALACGEKRFKAAQRRKRKDHFGQPSLEAHVTGAQGERAFAKWIGEPWVCTMSGFGGKADVRGCQVRAVTRTSLELKVRDSDPGRIPCVSIAAHPPRFWIRGFMIARDAKRPEWLADPGNRNASAWFVPNHELRPMAEFMVTNEVRAALRLPPIGA